MDNYNFEEIQKEYPKIDIGQAKNIIGETIGKGIVPLYRTTNEDRYTRFVCTAPCGHFFVYKTNDLLKKKGIQGRGCPICYKNKSDLTDQKFGMLTVLYPTEKRSYRHIIWHCKCDCGNQIDVIGSQLKAGSVQSCGCLKKEDLTGQKFGMLTVLKDSGERSSSNSVYWLCQCDCGNYKKVQGKHLKAGISTNCGCKKVFSKGQNKIIQILKNNNIPFETQKTFQTCKSPTTGYKLRFDFFINNQYLIEFDGKQHFQPTSGWATEELVQKNKQYDQYKNNWCKENNIPLIRIPYYKLDQLTIEDLLLK